MYFYKNIQLQLKIINKMVENITFSNYPGMSIASPSSSPNYKYHWIRDSAITMKIILKEYKEHKNNPLLLLLIHYIENEYKIQTLNTLSGLGEPKIHIDGTCFNEPWGRPQNDGPALRGLTMIDIYKCFMENHYETLATHIVLPIIKNDLQYVIDNRNLVSYDLWEEIKGYHFYTRVVQLKFIKECIHLQQQHNIQWNSHLTDIYVSFLDVVLKHIDTTNNSIISSYDENNQLLRYSDASIFLAFCHIDFDRDILTFLKLEYIVPNYTDLVGYFRHKYTNNTHGHIGRYKNDEYYGGHIWPLCSLGLVQCLIKLDKNKYISIIHSLIDDIISMNECLDIAEQYDLDTKIALSAKKLTWNYAELYMSII